MKKLCCIVSLAWLVSVPELAWGQVTVKIVDRSPQSEFAAGEIRSSVSKADPAGRYRVTLKLAGTDDAGGLQPEGFRIERTTNDDAGQITVLATDHAGLLYGGLEVAEIIRTLGIDRVRDDRQNPLMAMRGTKFNVPLDVRTPSYTDVCDAAQMNIPEVWSLDFWKAYIDLLARYRYNFVSLWSLHPFPSMVRVPEYPEVALDDVWRSKVQWQENYSLNGLGFATDEILGDVEVVKQMTIDEKIEFWRKVMAYGKSRNIDFYFVTWNIFTYGTGGKYGITDDYRNPTTIDYFRRSVTEMFRAYPDLAGIGLTTGENMPKVDFQAKEDWAMATYGQGVLDAVKQQPDRKVRFIHRQHMARATDIAKTFKPLVEHPNIDFIFSFKYAKAHVYSATKQPYHHDFVKDLGDLKTIWTLRNDDVYYFRWGAPDFVRQFVKNIPRDVSQGYYYGSDQYIWGREFLQRDAEFPRSLEVDKHFFQWLLWGRFGYNPDLGNDRLAAILADRMGLSLDDGGRLLDAWQHASMIYPLTTGFHWGALDFQWYIEGCQSRPGPANNQTGFHDVNRFITLPPHAESNCQSIPAFVKNLGKPAEGGTRTPPQVAELLDRHSHQARQVLEELQVTSRGELQRTLDDIEIVSELGGYYADKIRGATQLAVFRETGEEQSKAEAIEHLASAARHWHRFATLALTRHKNPLWTNRVGYVDWKENYGYVLEDIRIAGGDPQSMDLPAAVQAETVPAR